MRSTASKHGPRYRFSIIRRGPRWPLTPAEILGHARGAGFHLLDASAGGHGRCSPLPCRRGVSMTIDADVRLARLPTWLCTAHWSLTDGAHLLWKVRGVVTWCAMKRNRTTIRTTENKQVLAAHGNSWTCLHGNETKILRNSGSWHCRSFCSCSSQVIPQFTLC